MHTKHAIKNYSNANVDFDDPLDVVIKLFEALIKALYKVNRALDENDSKVFFESTSHAVEIVDCLHSGLDLSNESNLIKSLDKYYTNLFIKINLLPFEPGQEPVKLNDIIASAKTIRDKWIDFQAPMRKNIEVKPEGIKEEMPTNIEC
jgi:flagellin-specific chaperone FliS